MPQRQRVFHRVQRSFQRLYCEIFQTQELTYDRQGVSAAISRVGEGLAKIARLELHVRLRRVPTKPRCHPLQYDVARVVHSGRLKLSGTTES